MSRLFLKFFFAFWLIILIIALTATNIIWLREQSQSAPLETHLDSHAAVFLSLIEQHAKMGDDEDFKQLIAKLHQPQHPGHTFYALDADNKDILQRQINDDLLEKLNHDKQSILATQAALNIVTKQGTSFLLIAVEPDFYLLGPPNDDSYIDTFPSDDSDYSPALGEYFNLISTSYWTALAVLISLLFSALYSWYFMQPIRDLRQALAAVANGDLNTRLSSLTNDRNDEFSEVGANFDRMVEKLQYLIRGQQILLKDVSHELRSPLARIQAIIGIAQQQPDKLESTLSRLENEVQKMGQLIGELLQLSKVDTTENIHLKESVNITDLIADIIDLSAVETIDKQITINFNDGAEVSFYGYQRLLHRAIENIIRNAIKYSPEHGMITISLAEHAKKIILIIEDQGPGVIEEDLVSIFTPFFRSEAAKSNGTGLGLAIADRAIKKHHGTITAQNIKNSGLRITISLPR